MKSDMKKTMNAVKCDCKYKLEACDGTSGEDFSWIQIGVNEARFRLVKYTCSFFIELTSGNEREVQSRTAEIKHYPTHLTPGCSLPLIHGRHLRAAG